MTTFIASPMGIMLIALLIVGLGFAGGYLLWGKINAASEAHARALRQGLANEWEGYSEHNAHAWASPNDARRAMGLQPYEDTKQGRDILAEAEKLSREQFRESHRMKFYREMEEAKHRKFKEDDNE